ncbi:terminase [Aeromonas veronii]|uniref:terminase n=1 Tax=Aeromonas veronii TaxID=654 RepID=UPI003D1BF2B4
MNQRIDWSALQMAFTQAHAKSGIAAKEWCEQQGLNYHSARRYIKPRIAQLGMQSAQDSAQFSRGKVRNSGQSAQSDMRTDEKIAQSEQSKDRAQGRSSSSNLTPTGSSLNPKNNLASGRDENGRFTEGHRKSVGNAGNPHPRVNIKPGMQIAKAHGGYAQFLDSPELFDQAEELRLRDELIFTRARVISVTKTLKALQQDLATATEMADRNALYEKLLKAEQALDRNIQRIESIERTLSAMRIDAVTGPKIEADTKRIQAATRKLTAEADRLQKDGGSESTPVSEMVSELQGMGTGGLMS